MKKRFLSILMALCLALSLLPTAALAVEEGSKTQTENSVAKVDALYYDSLADAVKAITSEGTIELLADITLNSNIIIPQGKSVTIDLGTHTIRPVTEFVSFYVLITNRGNLTVQGEGTIDASNNPSVLMAIENEQSGNPQLNIKSGNIIGNTKGINIKTGAATISGGSIKNISAATDKQDAAVYAASGTEITISEDAQISGYGAAVRAYGADVEISDDASLTGQFGVMLFNSTGDNSNPAVHSSLTMTGGSIEATYGFALSGNNLESAGCEANITSGTLKQTCGEACIYWPMEGKLTVGGNAVVEGGTGIEAKMGTITIQDTATIRGTGAYLNSEPASGGSQADGSAILIATEMYGGNANQYLVSPDITVNIKGGTLESSYGNAVTVYNMETIDAPANVKITDGELNAAEGKAAVQVTNHSADVDKKTSGLTTEGGTNAFKTSKSQTTVTVSAGAALAAADQGSGTAYYTDVNDAVKSIDEGTVYVLGDSNVTAKENVTLIAPKNVPLTVRPSEGLIVQEITTDGETTYVLVKGSESQENVPTVTLSANRTSAYVGDSIILTATVTNAGGATVTYTWYRDGQKISGNSNTLTVTSSGNYSVVVRAVAEEKALSVEASPVACTFMARPESSDSSSSTTYSPTLDVSDGGTIKVSPRTPEAGDKVTITPDPDSGYEVGEVTVTDRSGDAVRVTANRDGTYTFTQPRGRVTIEVTFVRAGESAFFDDVPASFWAYDEIAWAYDNGYVNGTSATTFSPNSSITRQQVWMILARLSGGNPASMAAAREWAMANNISDGTNPGNAVTRQQLVALLYRYAQMMGYDNGAREALTDFPDAGTVSGYAQEPMQWSVANGIVAGTSAGTLNPAGTATRAQFAVILYRFWDQVG